MSSILLKNVILDGRNTNVLISGNKFASISAPGEAQADRVIDGEGQMAILPPFYNTHTHAAMSLLKGFADDLPLETWLKEQIWPQEEKLTKKDIYEGTKMAIREMIRTGTVFFNDMYFDVEEIIKATEEMGVRACIGITIMDSHSKAQSDSKVQFLKEWRNTDRIQIAPAPHAIYTVNEANLKKARRLADSLGMPVSIHLSETRCEVDDCIKAHGKTPVQYLDSIGLLDGDTVAAHLVKVTPEDIEILSRKHVKIAHCPCSNMKISSGIAPMQKMLEAGCHITIGTDGSASNNNLDMREEMKFAALLAKVAGKPTDAPAEEVYKWATVNGAKAFNIDAGVIAEGKLADAMLVDIRNYKMQPCHNLISNLVYAADSSCIDTVICNGRVLMSGRNLEV